MLLFGRRIKQLSPGEAATAHDRREVTLVDVREPGEWSAGVAPGALLIPLTELERRLPELPRGAVAFICRSGHRGMLAARRARRAGIDAANVRGGMQAWARAGEPITKHDRSDPRSRG